MSYWYLATPYKLYPCGKQEAYEAALEQTAFLLSRGIPVYSPIVHNHPLSLHRELLHKDGDFDFWVKTVDVPLMEGAGGLLVCTLESWERSKGIAFEIDCFFKLRKPVIRFSPCGDVSGIPPLSRSLDNVLRENLEWQDETFPLSTSQSRSIHLLREAKELAASPEDSQEMADVILLLSHLANGHNGPNVNLSRAVEDKQKVNRSRVWGTPDSDGVVEHVEH
jgi:hypothetical protein